jgi:hypothetical protein
MTFKKELWKHYQSSTFEQQQKALEELQPIKPIINSFTEYSQVGYTKVKEVVKSTPSRRSGRKKKKK